MKIPDKIHGTSGVPRIEPIVPLGDRQTPAPLASRVNKKTEPRNPAPAKDEWIPSQPVDETSTYEHLNPYPAFGQALNSAKQEQPYRTYFSAMFTQALQDAAAAAQFPPELVSKIDVEIEKDGSATCATLDGAGVLSSSATPSAPLEETVDALNTKLLMPRALLPIAYQSSIEYVNRLRAALSATGNAGVGDGKANTGGGRS